MMLEVEVREKLAQCRREKNALLLNPDLTAGTTPIIFVEGKIEALCEVLGEEE